MLAPLDSPGLTIVSADWGKHAAKRAVYLADTASRSVRRASPRNWSLPVLLHLAAALPGRVLIGLDVALGVPARYLVDAQASPVWRDCTDFLGWLSAPLAAPRMFDVVDVAADWRVETPFFRVPKGEGTLRAYAERTSLKRLIDERTGGVAPVSWTPDRLR